MNQKILLLDDDQSTKTLDLTWSTTRSMHSMPEGKQLRNCMKVKTVEESLKINIQTTARKTSRGELSVSFSDVEVRSHEMILGDNPAVSKGPPLTIDWDAFETTMCSVDNYEDVREPTVRNYSEMKMPAPVRFELLSRTTATKDIFKRTREANELKKKRLETTSTLYKARSQEKLERFTRGFKNLVTNKKKKEKEFMAQAMVSLGA
jgi:hypothetical protein